MTDTVLYETAGDVAVIRLNRPKALNALTTELKEGLLAALRRAAGEPVRAVLLTGNGRGFCAGQDLVEHADLLESGTTALNTVREHYNPIVMEITSMPKPVVAAVNGVAAGAGAGLALACDFRIAAESASLVMSFSAVGLGPDTGVSWTLSRLARAGHRAADAGRGGARRAGAGARPADLGRPGRRAVGERARPGPAAGGR